MAQQKEEQKYNARPVVKGTESEREKDELILAVKERNPDVQEEQLDLEEGELEELPIELNVLQAFFNHYIKELNGNPIPFGVLEGVLVAAEAVGGSGGIYMLPIVTSFTKHMPPELAWNFIITNPLSNVLFLINAADTLADTIIQEIKPPPQLKDILKLPSNGSLALKYFKMASGAIVCSIPFGAATYLFPLPLCTASICLGLTISHTMVSNTILHAIAWDILLKPENWPYRLPSVPLELGYKLAKYCLQPQNTRELLAIESKQEKIYQVYRNLVSASFSQATQRMVLDYIITKSPDKLRSLTHSSVAEFLAGNVYIDNAQNAAIRTCLSGTRSIMRNFFVILGVLLTIMAGLGWILNPVYIGIMEGLSLALSILIGSLPSYSTAVLFAFYGAMVSGQIYDYLTTWSGIRSKFSLEAQLYPKTFATFLLFNIWIAVFAFAGAEELIKTIFGADMWDAFRPVVEYESIPVFQILSFIPLLNLFNTFVRKSIAKFGCDSDHRLAARLLEKTQVMLAYLQKLDGAKLMESLCDLDAGQLKTFGINIEQLNKDTQRLEQLNQRAIALAPKVEKPRVREHSRLLMWSTNGTRNYSQPSGQLRLT